MNDWPTDIESIIYLNWIGQCYTCISIMRIRTPQMYSISTKLLILISSFENIYYSLCTSKNAVPIQLNTLQTLKNKTIRKQFCEAVSVGFTS